MLQTVTWLTTSAPSLHSSLQRDALDVEANHAYDLISLTMTPFHIIPVSAVVWKWFCRCPYAIGPVHDISSDEDFYTPPTTPLHDVEEHHGANMYAYTSTFICQSLSVHGSLSPAQSIRRSCCIVIQLLQDSWFIQLDQNFLYQIRRSFLG
jgi:hypothetical protein